MSYSVTINRPMIDVLDIFERIDGAMLPPDGGYSFEGMGGATRIRYTSSRGADGFFQVADLLIRLLSRWDRGANVPELVFES